MQEAKLKTQDVKYVYVNDWDEFVREVYNRPYSREEQVEDISDRTDFIDTKSKYSEPKWLQEETLDKALKDRYLASSASRVSLKNWLALDPDLPVAHKIYDWHSKQDVVLQASRGELSHTLWWERCFYPGIYELAYDLVAKGLLEPGTYLITGW